MSHEQELHDITREELKKVLSSSKAETDFNSNLLEQKNEEIHKLTVGVKDLTERVDFLYDDNLSLKSQLSSFLDKEAQSTARYFSSWKW